MTCETSIEGTTDDEASKASGAVRKLEPDALVQRAYARSVDISAMKFCHRWPESICSVRANHVNAAYLQIRCVGDLRNTAPDLIVVRYERWNLSLR